MRSQLIGNELFIAVDLILSPMEAKVFSKLSEGIQGRKRYGNQIGFKTIMRELMLNAEYTRIIINSLQEKIKFAYEIKEKKIGTYTYFILYEKKNI